MMSLQRTKRRMSRKTRAPKTTAPDEPALLSLGDHLKELQGRLFSTVFVFIVVAAIAYPFFDVIAEWLLAPLSDDQKLVYLTPAGAFSFMIKVCAYVGLIGTLPIIIYHIYKFIMPAVETVRIRRVLGYTLASIGLAISGILFAYYVSLPAALYFLTGFNLRNIDPMLTIDSYFSFIMTYMLAGAVLFQVPLLMMIVNSVTPLTPKKMMGGQKFIIVGSFVIAAIVSPTPDALNQTLLASPMIVMYQLGIVMIWRINAKANKKRLAQEILQKAEPETVADEVLEDIIFSHSVDTPKFSGEMTHVPSSSRSRLTDIAIATPVRNTITVPSSNRMMDIMPRQAPIKVQPRDVQPIFRRGMQSMDGIVRG